MAVAPAIDIFPNTLWLTGSGPEVSHRVHPYSLNCGILEISLLSSENFPPPDRKIVKPAAMPRTPICHSSKQVVPSQPEPNNIPVARLNTPILINRVKKPSMKSNPTIPSMIVNITIDHQSCSGLDTRYSMRGFIPNELGRK